MVEEGKLELKRAPGTCCPEPGCDNWSCHGCEYLGVCVGDPQRFDYCPRPRTCPSCGADCTKCDLWETPAKNLDFSKMSEGQALRAIGVTATEQAGQKGILLPSLDKTGKPLFIPASDKKPDAIVASERKQDRVKGAKKTRCADCRRRVYISPSSQEMLKRYPGTPVICIACFTKRAESETKKKKEAKS